MHALVKRMVCVGIAVCCAGPALACRQMAMDPFGDGRLLRLVPAAPAGAQGGWIGPAFIERRDRALDAMSAQLRVLDEGIARLRGEVAIRTVDGRLADATGLVAATERLEGQRAAAVKALQAARAAGAAQWRDVRARLEGHLRSTQAAYDATVANASR